MTTISYRSIDFWTPALHPNTLLHVAVPEPGPSRDPIVRHFAIKHGDHEPVSVVKKMTKTEQGLLLVDDSFKVSQVSVPTEEAPIPTISAQTKAKVPSKGTVMWSGLSTVEGRAISSLTSGRVSLYAPDLATTESLKLGAPALTLSTLPGSTHFAVAGKELEVCIFDAAVAFGADGKRKAGEALAGEVWRAKNLPHNSLRLRQPVYHLASTFLGSPADLLTGTKSGHVRRYDTRQRKPAHVWAVGRDGAGVQGLARSAGSEHEVFFSDLANTLGALDLRTGRPLYQVPGLSATTSWMAALPLATEDGAKFAESTLPKFSAAGLAAVASDATLRVCQTTPPPANAPVKGNWNTSGNKKAAVLASVGGVGVGSCVFDGFGTHTEVVERKEKEKRADDEDSDVEDEDVDDEEEEYMWGEMGEAEDGSEVEDVSDEEDDDAPARKRRK